jgi:uncharacterized protein
MILKETLTEIAKSQSEYILNSDYGIPREETAQIKIPFKFTIVISGIRRSGKSTLLRQLISRFKNFHYFNFEDVRAFGFELGDFKRLEEIFAAKSGSNIYFFDEIQNVANWEIFVRTLVDKKKKVIITGSNASLLSKEIGTKLTGRHIRYELFPFSYSEYLTFSRRKPSIKSFKSYFLNGGFPEYLKNNNDLILQELFNDIIARDIIVRYNLRNSKVVKDIALYLLSNVGKEFTFHRLRKLYEIGSANSVINLLNYYEDSYLLFTIPQFDYSFRKQIVNPKKIYAVDTGFIRANSVSFSRDEGRLLENVVFLQLKRESKEIFYFRKNNECDFITKDAKQRLNAYQVCYKLEDENKEREINGLLDALDYLKLKSGFILTFNQDDEFNIREKKIIVIPVWKWLLT